MESQEKLFERIIRAKVKLENMKTPHNMRCAIELNPEGFDPCTCGADARNAIVNEILRILGN